MVTCVDKSNVFRAYAFFRKIFKERAELFPDIIPQYHYVDAMALNLVRKPWEFDVLVAENMFADILSDLGGGIIGADGDGPLCAEIGENHGLFQPSHGSAGYRRNRPGQSNGDVPFRRHDAGMAGKPP